MTYQIHSGILYENCEKSVTRKLAYIKYPFSFTKKQILSPSNELLLTADIELIDSGKTTTPEIIFYRLPTIRGLS